MKFCELEEGKLYRSDTSIRIFRLNHGELEMAITGNTWVKSYLFQTTIDRINFRPYIKIKGELMELFESLNNDYNYMAVSEDGIVEVWKEYPSVINEDGDRELILEDCEYARLLPNLDIPFITKSYVIKISNFIESEREKFVKGCDL